MGATPSVQRDAKSPEDAPEDVSAPLSDAHDGETADGKPLQKNGQISISSLNGKTDDQTEYNGHTEENPPAEVGQTDTISPKEDSPETIEVHQEEVAPQMNGEKGDDSANADEITTAEEKVVEEKQEEANEVGFKKIFRFVGFKFTLKKDKNEKTEPVQLLTVKEAESGADAATEEKKEEPAAEEDRSVEEKSPETTENEAKAEEVTEKAEEPAEQTVVDAPSETEKVSDIETEKPAEETGTISEKEPEPEVPAESPTSPPSQETQSPFKRFFTQGIFSNLRKKASFKKPKDEEHVKEKPAEEDIKETEETAEGVPEATEEAKVDAENEPAEGEQIEKPSETVETKAETTTETTAETTNEVTPTEKEEQQDLKVEAEATSEVETVTHTEPAQAPAVETTQPTDDAKTSDKPDISEEAPIEPEILSSQEKSKAHGSPLKKLFTGAGLKKLSSKKHKNKKDAESKQTESSEQTAETVQSTESTEPQKPDSGASSPEESGEHVVGEVAQAEVAQAVEPDGDAVTSDGEKKKEGILPWSSFKKLVTPKKRVKRPSESEDEAPGDKPKSSTLSSTESAISDEKADEPKPSEEVPSKEELKEEAKEESQAESKTEPKAEKSESVAEEPKRKMDTSVSWEALICVGSSKKRARKTSDSDDEEAKIEEEVQPSEEEPIKTAESPLVSSGEADHENLASSPEPEGELVSTWESFKRLVTHRKKAKAEDKSDEASGPEQTTSDSETPKEESSFSLRKLIPRRKKKSDGKQEQVSSDVGSAEDDSDTPAVVPLSEYDSEPSAEAAVKAEEVKQESATVTQAKASAEDRSPSWISTTVENVEDETEGNQLSDIPEEGDTAATPKSTDNTIAEDIVELTSEAVTALEQVEETEMVSAVSRVTASPDTSGETTPVPGDGVERKTDVVIQEAVETISVTTNAMAVTMTEEQETVVAITTDALLVESATKEQKTVLVAHEKNEAVAVCTGLDTSEIRAVEEESLNQKPSVESATVVSQPLVTEVAVEEKTQEPERVTVTEDEVHEAQTSGVQAELKDQPIENAIEEKAQFEEIKDTPIAETVADIHEVAAVKVAVISAVQQEPEILEEPVMAEKSPEIESAGPVEATVEEAICAQTAEVTEVAVAEGEKVQELDDVKETVATVEVASVENVSTAVTEEVMATLPEVPASQIAGSTEDPIPVVAATEEFAVIKETICVSSISETTESHSADIAKETLMENVPVVLSTGDHKMQVAVNEVEVVSAQGVVEGNIEAASTKLSVALEEVTENVKEETEVIQATQVTEAEIIEKQSSVIVQEIIQNVVENFAEAHGEQNVSEKTTEESCITSAEVKVNEISVETTEEGSSTDKLAASDNVCKDVEETRIVTEKPPKIVNEAIQIAETVPVSITDEIQAQNEEVASVSVADVHQETEVTKSEVELKQAEEKSQSTKNEEGISEVESDLKEVQAEIQQEIKAVPEEKTAETSVTVASQDQVVAEQCQVTLTAVQIETAQEFNVGVVNVINADDVPETNMKEDCSEGQESTEDRPQNDLEEPQTKVSTNQEESRGPDCQKTDAKNVPAKLEAASEMTSNATAAEEVGNEIEPVSTEVVTVS